MNDSYSPKYNRKSLRLPDYDYSQDGLYFITIVTNHRLCLFGKIVEEKMILNDAGMMINQVCREIPQNMQAVHIDHFIIMPNHFHGIIRTEHTAKNVDPINPNNQPSEILALGNIVKRFKTLTTHRYIEGAQQSGWPRFTNRLWQRNYYEHVLRNERDCQAIVDYIQANPQNWERDTEYIG